MKGICKTVLPVLLGILLIGSLCGFTAVKPEAKLINTLVFSTKQLEGVSASYESDKIILLESKSENIVLREYCSVPGESYKATVSMKENILKIEGGKRPQNTSYSSYIELAVPADFTGSISLDTASGSIESADTGFQGPVFLSTASGNIQLSGIDFPLDCSVASGVIQVEGNALQGRLSAASGSVSVEMESLSGDLEIMVASGRVALSLPPTASFRLLAESMSGSVNNAFYTGQKSNEQAIAVGENPVHTITVDVASGNIDISKKK